MNVSSTTDNNDQSPTPVERPGKYKHTYLKYLFTYPCVISITCKCNIFSLLHCEFNCSLL